jgi:hypothetical protein
MDNSAALEKILATAQNVLNALEVQAAGFTTLSMPASLKVELEEKRKEVARLEALLNEHNIKRDEVIQLPEHLTSALKKLQEQPFNNLDAFGKPSMELSSKFREFLENTGIKFAHRNQEYVSINDLFVFPKLRILRGASEEILPDISGGKLWESNSLILVLGDEQSGKTTLAKRLFVDALSSEFLPIFIEGCNIKSSNIEGQLQKLVSDIYPLMPLDKFNQATNRVCIIDDIAASTLNKKAKSKLIESLNEVFSRIIIFADSSFQFAASDFPELDDYTKLEICPFNNVNRAALITKWVALELTEEADDQQIWRKIDELRLHVESLVRKNVVPAKPFHILLLLQSYETITTQRLELTSYGHCY